VGAKTHRVWGGVQPEAGLQPDHSPAAKKIGEKPWFFFSDV